MLARKKTSKNGKSVPQDWLEGLSRLLNQTFQSQSKNEDRYFDVYGQIYPEELLLVVSWLSEKDQNLAPIALFISCDPEHLANEKKVKETQKDYVDLVGLFFDEIFAKEDWDEFEPNWQEVTLRKEKYFYKISRENINLTLEADRLLGPDFIDVENEE